MNTAFTKKILESTLGSHPVPQLGARGGVKSEHQGQRPFLRPMERLWVGSKHPELYPQIFTFILSGKKIQSLPPIFKESEH